MTSAASLGFPRLGAQRELKAALEGYWAGESDAADLAADAARVRQAHWQRQCDAGIDHVPCGDFSLYDHVLDTSAMLGAVPRRFGWDAEHVDVDTYFAMARGTQQAAALGLTKWFDTNYHYLVPELGAHTRLRLASTKPVDEFIEARAHGVPARPVLLGPVSYLLLAKPTGAAGEPLDLLDDAVAVYRQVLSQLADAGADWVQIDEPCLVLDLDERGRSAYERAYAQLAEPAVVRLLVATYFADLGPNLDTALGLPVDGLHVDLVRAPHQLTAVLEGAGPELTVSLGLVDGRNVWRSDLDHALGLAEAAQDLLGSERMQVAPSCSLLHVPVDLDAEPDLDDELRSWLAFAAQKLDELATLRDALDGGREAVAERLDSARTAIAGRAASGRTHDPAVRARSAAVDATMSQRTSPVAQRGVRQARTLALPLLPTTTIGSFPQTPEVRRQRAAHRRGALDDAAYEQFLRAETAACVRAQEEAGLDVLVHGEFERTDMVEYFGQRLAGFAFTRNGWVQSYGSRGVKPPIIYGDVARPEPMTLDWTGFAQSLTERPVKGMLTGPVTILQWSFVRDDQPRSETCQQIALALRDEVADLEAAGSAIIQIDEPALREGLPLRRADWDAYLGWATTAFRLAAAVVSDDTQIHSHMCYAEVDDILAGIEALDVDVLSVEAARSRMEVLDDFAKAGYPAQLGPGVYDIHSPRVPEADELADLLRRALAVLPAEQVWVNPDCGLKTRRWQEVRPALAAMVAAAHTVRADLAGRR